MEHLEPEYPEFEWNVRYGVLDTFFNGCTAMPGPLISILGKKFTLFPVDHPSFMTGKPKKPNFLPTSWWISDKVMMTVIWGDDLVQIRYKTNVTQFNLSRVLNSVGGIRHRIIYTIASQMTDLVDINEVQNS